MENPEHDFVAPLVQRYLEDLAYRQEKATCEKASYCAQMRKPVSLNGVEQHIDKLRKTAEELKNAAFAREAELETARLLAA